MLVNCRAISNANITAKYLGQGNLQRLYLGRRTDDQFDRYDHQLRIAECGDSGDPTKKYKVTFLAATSVGRSAI